ncbi:unnamed protein product [Choristocarpus tenellus]
MSAVATITALALVLIGSAPTTGLITWSGRATCGMPCHRKLSTSILTYASKVDDMNVATTEVDVSKGQSEGTVGGISLTYLEINSWMWEVNGLRVLVDPLFGTLDFGIPALFRGEKKVGDVESIYRQSIWVSSTIHVIRLTANSILHPPIFLRRKVLRKVLFLLLDVDWDVTQPTRIFPAERLHVVLTFDEIAISCSQAQKKRGSHAAIGSRKV